MGEARTDDHPRRDARGRRLSGLVKRSFSVAGHRTSIALEPEFWEALDRIAAGSGRTVSSLVAEVDGARTPDRPLASTLRVWVLRRLVDPTGDPTGPR